MGRSLAKKILVNDKMQRNYVYKLLAPQGKDYDPSFRPQLTPLEMLKLGVFGGRYLRDCRLEFPDDWFKEAKLYSEGRAGHDISLNYFQIEASQPLAVWRAKGWINEQHDPRGWFQWYCRYYLGRRLPEEDHRQIARWRAMKRHIMQIKNNCRPGDITCRPRQRQALLHWAYDSRYF